VKLDLAERFFDAGRGPVRLRDGDSSATPERALAQGEGVEQRDVRHRSVSRECVKVEGGEGSPTDRTLNIATVRLSNGEAPSLRVHC